MGKRRCASLLKALAACTVVLVADKPRTTESRHGLAAAPNRLTVSGRPGALLTVDKRGKVASTA